MIQTTKDILFLVLGVSILVVSFFFSLLLYYLVKAVSELHRAAKSVSKVTTKVDEIAKSVKEKISGFSFMPLMAEAIKTVIDFMRDKKKGSKKKVIEE